MSLDDTLWTYSIMGSVPAEEKAEENSNGHEKQEGDHNADHGAGGQAARTVGVCS